MKMNKRGQGLPVEFIVLLVIIVLVGIGILLWQTNFFGVIETTTETYVPSELAFKVSACTAVSSINKFAFCSDFDEVKLASGKDGYVNCVYAPIEQEIKNTLKADGTIPPVCDGTEAKTFCVSIEKSDDTVVNGKPCSTWNPPLGGGAGDVKIAESTS